jgi:SAM-dependent methyltransferase
MTALALPCTLPDHVRTIASCEVCGHEALQTVLDLGSHALCDDLVPVGDPRLCRRYPIEILWCDQCRTAHQRHQVPKQELFPRSYHYRAALTRDVLDGMAQLVASVIRHEGPVTGQRVLDVGCNDGSLLSVFAAHGAHTFGIDPTDAALEARARGHVVQQAYFDPDVARTFVAAHGHPDVITFTNVFAHIEDLPSVVKALRILMRAGTRLVIENHDLGAVIARRQFDTFYHEHPRTYSRRSFEVIADSLGCHLSRVEYPSRYGGNIRVVMTPGADPGASTHERPAMLARPDGLDEAAFGDGLQALQRFVTTWQGETRAQIDTLVATHGPLRAKAFPGRAAILVELLQLDAQQLCAVYEQPTSPKIGHYVPGTRIPIRSDDAFDAMDESPVLNLAWHIHAEIERYLRQRGFRGMVLPVLHAD